MPCYRPLSGYRSQTVNESGKRSIVFNINAGFSDMPVELPCGQCIGCRLERSRQWAIRCTHEASLWEQNAFITLTYSPEHLPPDNSLNVEHFQLFMKRLRKKFGTGIRYFHCGEYGEKFKRPHYHACLFNFDFPDKQLLRLNHDGDKLYTSEVLNEIWGKGHTIIGDVTFESAAYCARYITKKITGENSESHYQHICEISGEITQRKPEYTTMSRRPGIGMGWFEKYNSEIFANDFIFLNGKKLRPPKYYNQKYELINYDYYQIIKKKRDKILQPFTENSHWTRLRTREKIQLLRFSQLQRSYENE